MHHRFPTSERLFAAASRVDAGLAARRGLIAPQSSYPIFVERAQGAYVVDADGNRFLDLLLAFGCVILGHADERVNEAVIEQIRQGIAPTLLSRRQIELAQLLSEVIPGVQSCTFLKTGSDATAVAVRLARAFTGRRRVLQWGYHGWHEWCASRPVGVTTSAREFTSAMVYNTPESAQRLFGEHGDDIACILMMPFEVEQPAPGYLAELRELAHAHGALFIFDEIRSGFRMALGGAQQYFNVQADLATYSKAIANGHAISVVAGRADILECLAHISASSAFFRSPDGMAAALRTIQLLRDEPHLEKIHRLGRQLMAGIDQAAQRHGARARATGCPPMPFIEFGFSTRAENERAMQVFCEQMLAHGVLVHPSHHWFICSAMSDADLQMAIAAADAALESVARLG